MSTPRNFRLVNNEPPEAPYPEDTKANGYKPEVDWQRIKSSKTWRLCPAQYRPWMLMLWLESWNEVPAGSWEDDDELIAAAIGMDLDLFTTARKHILRGWERANDGRLYHRFIASQVSAMLEKRTTERLRKQNQRGSSGSRRKSNVPQDNGNVPRDNRDVPRDNGNVPRDSAAEQEQEQEQEKKEVSNETSMSPDASDDAASTGKVTKIPSCPHKAIIALYHETLPELPRIVLSRWPGSASEPQLRARWREDARHRSLEFWRRFFTTIRSNPFWLGRNDRGWTGDLHWFVKRQNFDKVVTRMAEGSRRG